MSGFPAYAGNDAGGTANPPFLAGNSGNEDIAEDGFPAFAGNDSRGENIIENIFSAKSLEDVIKKLKKNASPFAKNTLDTMLLRSPLSLKVTWEHLKRCEKLSFDDIIQENYVMTNHFLKGHDFFEGVRAQIIDKDKNPKWQPAKLSDITDAQIAAYFK